MQVKMKNIIDNIVTKEEMTNELIKFGYDPSYSPLDQATIDGYAKIENEVKQCCQS